MDKKVFKNKVLKLLEDNYFSYEDTTDNLVEGYYPDLKDELIELIEKELEE
jgi:hypothetical protein